MHNAHKYNLLKKKKKKSRPEPVECLSQSTEAVHLREAKESVTLTLTGIFGGARGGEVVLLIPGHSGRLYTERTVELCRRTSQ